jgi:hypothetical protein
MSSDFHAHPLLCVLFELSPSELLQWLTVSLNKAHSHGENHADGILGKVRHDGLLRPIRVLCPCRLLRAGWLLCAGLLLQSSGLYTQRLLLSNRLLHSGATKGWLRLR